MLASLSTLIGLMLGVLASGAESKSLINQLGSPRFAEREAASEALERLGQEAFPILKEARKDRDPEVKNRAELLLDAIERTMLTKPSSVNYPGGRQTLSWMVEELSRVEGVALQVGGPDTAIANTLAERKAGTFTFWQALDLLDLQPVWEPDLDFERVGPRRESGLRLVPRRGIKLPVSDSGPFRIVMSRLPVYVAEAQLIQGFPAPRVRREGQELVVAFDVQAEPRLGIHVTSLPKIYEAVDDQGQTLALTRNNVDGDGIIFVASAERFGSKFSTAVHLQAPDRRSKTLVSLRGAIPIEVESRRIDPTVIPIGTTPQSDRKPFAAAGFTLVVNGVVPQRFGGGIALEVTLRPDGYVGPVGRGGGRRNAQWEQMLPEEEKFLKALEVVDSDGRRFRTEPRTSSGGADGKHFFLDLTSKAGGDSQPVEVHYYGQIRMPIEIPFHFKNVKLP